MARESIPNNKKSKRLASKSSTGKLASQQRIQQEDSNTEHLPANKPQTSPALFTNSISTSMASALPIWEASSILTQKKDLPWSSDPNGKLCYAREVEGGKGAILFWVTEDLKHEYPATLAGAAALAVIDTFDIRAACMHLIYAAHATQLKRPWEQEFVIDDRQIEEYLGLKKRTDRNRQQKLALIQEIAQQPCKITTFISWPAQGKTKGFTVEEGRLWHLLGTRYHYQQDLFGNKELTGITFTFRAGLWARHFLDEERRREIINFSQFSNLSKDLLEDIMSLWQHREGAVRLMVWLLFKTKVDRQHPLVVKALLEVAYGTQRIQAAKENSQLRKKLVNTWDEDLLALHDRGWHLHFHPATYPLELQPLGFRHSDSVRPRGFFDQLLSAQIWIAPPENWGKEGNIFTPISVANVQELVEPGLDDAKTQHSLTGAEIRVRRKQKGWSQPKLAEISGLSQGLISLLENEKRSLTKENQEVLERAFALDA